jgi:polysaccharide biosynthesis transport protein
VSELKQRYGDKHPQMVTAVSELRVAKSNTDQQIQKVIAAAEMELKTAKTNTTRQVRQVVDSITKEYEVARANMEALQQAMSEKEVHIQDINRKEYQLGVLQREVDVNKQLYDLFLTRFNETDASKGLQSLQSTIGRVIDPALIATSPFKPKKQMIIGISLVLGFMFAAMLAFLIEYLDNTIKNGDDVEQKLGMPLLGTLPDLKINKGDKDVKPRVMFLEHEKSQFAESIRTIRTGIMLSTLNTKNKVLVITSSTMGEGKTTFAVNQAFALGQMGPTLLIDADMRRPAVAKTFGFTNKKPGLSELVAGTKTIDECIISDPDTKIHLLPSGAIPPNPLELLSSPQFGDLLEDLSERYTHIIIDSPPMQAVSDAMVLSTHASAVVYVVRADSTPYKLVQESIKQLRQTNAHLLGIVLNKVDTRRLSNYYNYKYGYSKGYHSGYHQAYYSHSN